MTDVSKTVLIAFGVLATGAAFAADLPTKKEAPAPIPEPVLPSPWRFDLIGYGWGSSLAGNVGVAQFQSVPFYASVGTILEHLEGVFMGSAIARNGTFIGGVDFIWTRLGQTETLNKPPWTGTEVDVKLGEDIVSRLTLFEGAPGVC